MFISKKELTYLTNKVDELERTASYINNTNIKLMRKVNELEEHLSIVDNSCSSLMSYCHDKLCKNYACVKECKKRTQSEIRAERAMKIKVKGTPGRPKKIEVKVKRGPGRPRKNTQPRTKDGKFAKKK